MGARRGEWRQQAQMAVHRGYEEEEGTSRGWHLPPQMQLYFAATPTLLLDTLRYITIHLICV